MVRYLATTDAWKARPCPAFSPSRYHWKFLFKCSRIDGANPSIQP